MSQNKRQAEMINRLSLLIGTTLLLHLMLTPLVYTGSIELTSGKQYSRFALSEDAYIINEVNNYEILNDVRIKSILNRNLRDFQRLLKRALDTTLQPVLTIAIILVYILTNLGSTKRRKSLLAFSLGGHAPPVH